MRKRKFRIVKSKKIDKQKQRETAVTSQLESIVDAKQLRDLKHFYGNTVSQLASQVVLSKPKAAELRQVMQTKMAQFQLLVLSFFVDKLSKSPHFTKAKADLMQALMERTPTMTTEEILSSLKTVADLGDAEFKQVYSILSGAYSTDTKNKNDVIQNVLSILSNSTVIMNNDLVSGTQQDDGQTIKAIPSTVVGGEQRTRHHRVIDMALDAIDAEVLDE